MFSARLLILLLLPFLALAQDTTSGPSSAASAPPTNSNASGSQTPAASASPSLTTVLSTFLVTSVTIGPGRVESTFTISRVFTSVMPISTESGGSNNNAGSSSSTTVTPANLPTAPANVDGGGQNGAPVPGASSPNGAFGPDDDYIAAATALAKNLLAGSAIASLVAGAVLLL
ncbi:unnamed protein product [Cyclocybe aegerita]|uniref:Uncharacterized protein n=1 Tax=Cyclocybe aegerita TaxID=1973307 RepID=A0A8S0X427_CYCAE|nr:unnamed protein product [Cyclocybe aegerita]